MNSRNVWENIGKEFEKFYIETKKIINNKIYLFVLNNLSQNNLLN